MLYKILLKPLLFLQDAEKAHHFVFSSLKIAFKLPGLRTIISRAYQVENDNLKRKLFGLEFPNPVGLAAGFDKDAKLYKELASFGFGFIEIGTITPKAQEGNPKPRLFRLKEDQALINRMGFNNGGADAAVDRLVNRPKGLIVGGNIGKNKSTPNELAEEDYLKSFKALHPHVDYFVVNVSSPNTPNLRELQEKKPLSDLLLSLKNANKEFRKQKPILLKIAPDLSHEQLDDIIEIVQTTKIDGIISSNTTIDRSNLKSDQNHINQIGAGGLSGLPLKEKSTEIIAYLSSRLGPDCPIIAVGGIFTGEDALEKLKAGASLVQVYTGFIYEGPGMVKKINSYLAEHHE